MIGGTPGVIVKFETDRPLDLLDLTTSLSAFADEYRRMSHDGDARLYVESITEGSIVAKFVSITKGVIATGAPLLPIALDTLGPFMGHWSGLLTGLANYGRDAAQDANTRLADKQSLRNARNFVQPAINGNSINVQGDAQITQINLNIGPETAGDISRTVGHLLSTPFPDTSRFENEPLQLYQVRDAKAGDLGYIDRFDKRPRRLTFANETAKNEMLHGPASPFDVFFFVSGYVKTAGGEVASYLIDKIDGITPKEAG